jgi:hypothetical protein
VKQSRPFLAEQSGLLTRFAPRNDGQTGCLAVRLKSLTAAMLALLFDASAACALEQCRFIQAKPEREACCQRQEAELAARRKVAPQRDSRFMQSLEQMKHEDESLNRQIHGICRGC